MKKILILMLCLFLATTVFAADNPWDRKLPFKSATISYSVDGTMKGKKTLYLKDYGRTQAEYTEQTMSLFGINQQQKELVITTPDWVYTVDLLTGTGDKQVNPIKYFIDEYNRLSPKQQAEVAKNAEKTGFNITEGVGGEIEKNAATVMGYDCDRVTVMGMTVYAISGTGLALKTEGNTMGIKIMETATAIDKGTPPADKFTVPANIQLNYDQQVEPLLQAQAKSVISALIEGRTPVVEAGAAQPGRNGGSPEAPAMSPEQMEQMQQLMKMFGKQN